MKLKKLFLIILCSLVFQIPANVTFSQTVSESGLILKLDSPKNVYKPGEKIDFLFELENGTNEIVKLLDLFGTGTGFLNVEASQNGNEFADCSDPGWGLLDVDAVTYIKPNESVKAKSSVLWSRKTQDASGFRFDEAGVYYIKAVYAANIEGKKSHINIESAPIRITIEEPVGDDLRVWNIIKKKWRVRLFYSKERCRYSFLDWVLVDCSFIIIGSLRILYLLEVYEKYLNSYTFFICDTDLIRYVYRRLFIIT